MTSVRTHVIDLDARPRDYKNLEAHVHERGGRFLWDPEKVSLYTDSLQAPWPNGLRGCHLQQRLEGQLVLNANALEYLLKYPHLIPDEWKGLCVFFWGTTYFNHWTENWCVRYLYWSGNDWKSDDLVLEHVWCDLGPAAVMVSGSAP